MVGMPLVARWAVGPVVGVMSTLYAADATRPGWWGGLVVPLGGALMALLAFSRTSPGRSARTATAWC
ncbi:hypothetical protein ACFQ1I_18475 [Kitasatospora arboriphila]